MLAWGDLLANTRRSEPFRRGQSLVARWASAGHRQGMACFRYLSATGPPPLGIIRGALTYPESYPDAYTVAGTRIKQMTCLHRIKLLFSITLGVLSCSCAALQPPEPGGPRSTGPLYPILFTEQAQRTDASNLAFNRLTQSPATQSAVQLQPITAAIQNLPNLSTPVYLPKVGINPEMDEEETRESLRRFITDWRVLIGADPAHLSLVERIDRPDGVKTARYEQRPFRYPLRGGYGSLEIQFLPTRVVRNITSTCLPDAERLQSALAPVTPKLTAADAINVVRSSDVSYTDTSGQQPMARVGANEEVTPVELVTLVFPTSGRTDSLELHIAWEINVGVNPRRLVYVDAVEGKVLQVTLAP